MPTPAELYKQSEQLRKEGQVDEAIARLEELLKLDDQHVLAHLSLAVLLGKAGRHADAVQHGERACQLEPTDVFNFTALSVTYQRAFEGTRDREYIYKAEEAKQKAQQLQWQQR